MRQTAAGMRREVRKAATDVRRHLGRGLAFLDAGDTDRAYAEMEAAQHAAYDAKRLTVEGGTYEPQEAEEQQA